MRKEKIMAEKEKPYEAAGKHIKLIRLSLYKGDKPHTVNAATKEINRKPYLCRAKESMVAERLREMQIFGHVPGGAARRGQLSGARAL